MIDKNYNEKFRKFFSKFEKQFSNLKTQEEKEFTWDLVVDYVEKNRDFVMQYPLVHSWENIDTSNYNDIKKTLLTPYQNKNINLYFHIPFCKTKCTYCNFHIIVGDNNKNIMQKIYIEKLKQEVQDFLQYNNSFEIDTIFIGGGTPSYLDNAILEDLLQFIQSSLGKFMSKQIEFSFEGNPDSITEEKIEILKKYGVNRISIGVQTFDNEIIKNINRTYTADTVFEVINNLKKAGLNNINVDMIYGLPGSNKETNKKDLEIVKELDISHITYYPLYYYENSILSKTNKGENKIKEIYNFYDEIVQTLQNKNFVQYGREYFAKGGKIHHYQSNYVSNKLLYGFGHSAYSFNSKQAFYKKQNLREYIKETQNIESHFLYDDETFDRRLFVLGGRNIKIEKKNIKNINQIREIIKLPLTLGLIKEESDNFTLTYTGLKYQEILAHMLV